MSIEQTNKKQITNIYLTKVMLDIGFGDGLFIDGSGVDGVQAIQADLVLSCSSVGQPNAHGIKKIGKTIGCTIRSSISGYRGTPLMWVGESLYDLLDLSPGIRDIPYDQTNSYGIVLNGMTRGEVRLGTVGGEGSLIGGVRLLADVVDVDIIGGRLGGFQAGGAALTIDQGFSGRLTATGIDCTLADVGLVDNSLGGTKLILNCPGISPLYGSVSQFIELGDGSSMYFAVPVPGALMASQVSVSFNTDIVGLQSWAYVQAPGNIYVIVKNDTGVSVSLGYVEVFVEVTVRFIN